MILRSGLFSSLVGYLFFPSSTIIVASFSTTARHLRNQYSDVAAKNGSFGPVQQRSCRQVDTVIIQKMVVDSNTANLIDGNDGTKVNNGNEDAMQREPQPQTSVWDHLSDWFQGDFDNYAQVIEDREQNLEPREGGGHEHFHCTLVPVTESTRLAAFFFDGNPDRIFRFRYYEMIPSSTEDGAVEMMLNTLHPDLEKILKSEASNPLRWPSIFENYQPSKEDESKVNRLPNCEISWSFQTDPIQHSYLVDTPENDVKSPSKSLHAIMIHGPTIVNSTIVPGMQIRIIDQLSLFQNTFYINDRGFDPTTGSFIYGNQREVPYRLERVSSILPRSASIMTQPSPAEGVGLQRKTSNSDLEWTLGQAFRSTEDYERKLESIGGPSVGMKKNIPKKSS